MRRSPLVAFVLLCGLSLRGLAEPAARGPPGFVERSYVSPIDDSNQNFRVFVPRGYDRAKRWPLLVFLHGAGEWENAARPTEVGLPVRQRMESFPFLVAYP